jgi:hypothetical protein
MGSYRVVLVLRVELLVRTRGILVIGHGVWVWVRCVGTGYEAVRERICLWVVHGMGWDRRGWEREMIDGKDDKNDKDGWVKMVGKKEGAGC